MAHLMDIALTSTILVVVSFFTVKYLWKIIHPPKHMSGACVACESGCEMQDVRNEFHKKHQHHLPVIQP